ncbi:MAG: peptide chain release factor N(5)-glutamine methyltransferase, partial [Chloroflexota bacterium]|nr:peptide chain release factor N(5)-glutamine methyltransferase [Chloroflexota bacterium]
ARINCEKHGVTARVSLLQGDLLDPLPETVDLIIANLPYVTTDDAARLQPEPRLALDGGADGLDKIVQLCRQVGGKLRPPGSLLLEIGQGQGGAVTGILRRLFPTAKVEVFPDLSGIERLVSLTLTI